MSNTYKNNDTYMSIYRHEKIVKVHTYTYWRRQITSLVYFDVILPLNIATLIAVRPLIFKG